MAYPVSQYSSSFRDYDGEVSNSGIWVATLSAANFTAQGTLAAAYQAAIEAILLGEPAAHKTIASNVITSAAKAGTTNAQREVKWLARYHDTSGRKYTYELPTADFNQLAMNSEFFDSALTTYSDFKTAFEAYAVSPGDMSAVTLDSLQLVGRRT